MTLRKSRSAYAIIISSYVIIVIIFTVLMGGLFLYSAQTITRQLLESDEYISERVVRQADDEFENLYRHGEMLVQDNRLSRFIDAPASGNPLEAFREIGDIMDRANQFTSLTADLFFCPAGNEVVLNRTGFHTGPDLEKLLQETMGITPDEWRERTAFDGTRSFQVVTGTDSEGREKRQFLMMVRRPQGGISGMECFVAGIVPLTMIRDISGAVRPEGYEDIVIEFPDGLYSFRRQGLMTPGELAGARQKKTDVFSLLFSSEPVYVTACRGKVNDTEWTAHFFCSMEPYRNVVRVCLRNFIISEAVVLILGSILLYFTLSKHIRPLKILMDRISGRRRSDGPALHGEYQEIDRAIGRLQEQQQGMRDRLAEYRMRLQSTEIRQLLRGTGEPAETLTDFFRQQELNLCSEECRVLLVALDADEIIGSEEENVAGEQLTAFLEEMENRIYQALPDSCCIITDYCVECLISGDDKTREEEALRLLRNSLTEYCRKNRLHFFAAVSAPETGTEGAHRAFLQAETILDHATMTGYRDAILDELPEERPARVSAGRTNRRQQLLEYVNEHYTDASLSVLQMADVFDMSPSSVSRTFKQAADTGLNTYIHTLRVAKAKELIENTDDSLKVISEAVGYGNQITMIRAFKNLEGITPREYRDQIRGIHAHLLCFRQRETLKMQ